MARHYKSDVRIIKIINKVNSSKLLVNCNKQIINLEIKDLNIHNVLASITILKELKIDLSKINLKFKNLSSPEGRGKKAFYHKV